MWPRAAALLGVAAMAHGAPGVQSAVTHAMEGRQGTAVVMDVASGRVLASHRLDLAGRRLVRPGSTVKPFVLAAMVEGGWLKPGETFRCGTHVRLNGRNLDCSHVHTPYALDGAQALAYSCNSFFAQAAARVRPGELAAALRRAIPPGLGEIARTATIEEQQLQALGEAGIRVTPMQLAEAYRKLALKPPPDVVRTGLEGAAAYGTARLAQARGWRIAGKTGTSTEPGTHVRHAWFAGYAPAAEPRFVVLVFLEQGRGGSDAAPVAGEILDACLSGIRETEVTVRRYWLQKRNEKPERMTLEHYVAAVMAGECKGYRSEEALKAMAVLIRTFAMRNRGRHAKEGFDFCDTTHCQDYRGVAMEPRFERAAAATRGELLWHGGDIADVYYHADCGGVREPSWAAWPTVRQPYLERQRDPYCGGRPWRSEVLKTDLQRALSAAGLRVPARLEGVAVDSRTPSGRVDRLQLRGSHAIPVSATSFRFAVGRLLGWEAMPSTWFEIADCGDRLTFTGRGSGHGVGLCQAGASRMAEAGHGYAGILQFYFPGTELGVSARGFAWRALAGEAVDVLTTRARDDAHVVLLADRAAREAQERVGARFTARPQIRVYPTVAAFRNATGEPGWVAASTRGRVVRVQPPSAVRDAMAATLRHELMHILVESRAHTGLPLWFREGLVLYLAEPGRPPTGARVEDEDLLRANTRVAFGRAYQAARSRVAGLAARHGRETVLAWLTSGLPPEARALPPEPAGR